MCQWIQVVGIIELMKPFTEFITQLEANRPYLSQMCTIWASLDQHIERWEAKSEVNKGLSRGFTANRETVPHTGVREVLKDRAKFSYHPAMPAAYILDPINWTDKGDQNEVCLMCEIVM